MNSRAKGKAGELELAHWLQNHGIENARRGQQFSGQNGDADVEGLEGIHIECKRVENVNVNKWLAQATDDAYADSLKRGKTIIPVVFHRQNKGKRTETIDKVKGEWKVTLFAEDFLEIYKGVRHGS